MKHIEHGKNMPLTKSLVAMDARLGWIVGALKVDQGFVKAMQLPKTGGRYLLTRESCPGQTGRNAFKHEKDRNPRYFLLVTGLQATTIWRATVGIGTLTA